MRLEQTAQPGRKRVSSFHRLLSGDEELDVLGHQGEDRIDVALCSGVVPALDEVSDVRFFAAHKPSCGDAEIGPLNERSSKQVSACTHLDELRPGH